MASKRIIVSIIAIAILAILCLCILNIGKLNNAENNTPTEQVSIITPAIPIEKYLWEKERQFFDLSTIKLDKNWDSYITIGDAKITSSDLVDISTIPNYFFNEQNTPSKLQTAYNVSTKNLSLTTDENSLKFDFQTKFTVSGTTIDHNVIIENIIFIGFTDPNSQMFEQMKSSAPYTSDDCFGIGSTYKQVVAQLGEPTVFLTDPMSGFNLTKLVYKSDYTKLVLTFTWVGDYSKNGEIVECDENATQSATLTSIEWEPIVTKQILHTQEDMETFLDQN